MSTTHTDDLLAALKELLEHNAKVREDDEHYCFDETNARAAIAKAEQWQSELKAFSAAITKAEGNV